MNWISFSNPFISLYVARRIVSKAALTKARRKLKFEAFSELNQHLVNYFYSHFSPLTWFGFRLLAIDGSTTRLPIITAIAEHFGVWKVRQGAASPTARVSQLFDVLNKITIDAIIHPKSTGERELVAQHMLKVMPNDLILLDRGYPVWWIFAMILPTEANFCARLSCTKWKVVHKITSTDTYLDMRRWMCLVEEPKSGAILWNYFLP